MLLLFLFFVFFFLFLWKYKFGMLVHKTLFTTSTRILTSIRFMANQTIFIPKVVRVEKKICVIDYYSVWSTVQKWEILWQKPLLDCAEKINPNCYSHSSCFSVTRTLLAVHHNRSLNGMNVNESHREIQTYPLPYAPQTQKTRRQTVVITTDSSET